MVWQEKQDSVRSPVSCRRILEARRSMSAVVFAADTRTIPSAQNESTK